MTYAIGALLLLLLRAAYHRITGTVAGKALPPTKPARLAGIGLALYAVPLALVLLFGLAGSLQSAFLGPSTREDRAQQDAAHAVAMEREAAVFAYRDGSYADAVRQRAVDMGHQLEPFNLLFFLFLLLGIYFLGMAILRAGIVVEPRAHARTLQRMRNFGLPVGLAVMGASTALGTRMDLTSLRDAVQLVTYLIAGLVLALAYGATLVLALQGRIGPWLQRWLAPAGRMALTNYLLQSAFGTLLFYNYGLGLWGRIGRAEGLAYAFAFFVLQLVLSRAWLAYFRFGPFEWLWRALTYLHLPPMRREATD